MIKGFIKKIARAVSLLANNPRLFLKKPGLLATKISILL